MPKVVSLKIKELRKRGYNNVEEWLNKPGHVYIGRQMRIFIWTNDKSTEPTGTKVGYRYIKGKSQKILIRPDNNIKGKPFCDKLLAYPAGSYVRYGQIIKCYIIPESPFHNPYKRSSNVIGNFEEYLLKNKALLNKLSTLQNAKEIGCWCKPKPCHGDTILKYYHKWKFNHDKQLKYNNNNNNNNNYNNNEYKE